eukprot:4485715-Prymnesium_polylepis.1
MPLLLHEAQPPELVALLDGELQRDAVEHARLAALAQVQRVLHVRRVVAHALVPRRVLLLLRLSALAPGVLVELLLRRI